MQCKIVTIINSLVDIYENPYQYTIIQDPAKVIRAKKYYFEPSCDYTETFSISVNIMPSAPRSAFYTVDSESNVTLDTKNLYNAGEYEFTLSSVIDGYPSSYPKHDI